MATRNNPCRGSELLPQRGAGRVWGTGRGFPGSRSGIRLRAGRDLVWDSQSPEPCRGDQRHVWKDAQCLFQNSSPLASWIPKVHDAEGHSFSQLPSLVYLESRHPEHPGKPGVAGEGVFWLLFCFLGYSPRGRGHGSRCPSPPCPLDLCRLGGGGGWRIFQPLHTRTRMHTHAQQRRVCAHMYTQATARAPY